MVVPRVGPMILIVVSVVALVGAGIQHYSMFSAEYRLSTWQNTMVGYGPFVVLGIALLFILSATLSAVTGNAVSAPPMEVLSSAIANMKNTLPTAASATNMVTAGINKGITALAPASASSASSSSSASTGPSLIPTLGYRASEV